MKKATVENLLKMGVEGQSKLIGTIKCFDMEFEYHKLPIMAVLDIIDEYGDNTKEQIAMTMEIIYMTIPVFRDAKLQEQFKCVEPHDVVLKVLGDSLNNVLELGKKVIELYNISNAVEDAKK